VELESVEQNCEEMRKCVIQCGTCAEYIPHWMVYGTSYSRDENDRLNEPTFTCACCDKSLLDFSRPPAGVECDACECVHMAPACSDAT
jgi:hypothetical protein